MLYDFVQRRQISNKKWGNSPLFRWTRAFQPAQYNFTSYYTQIISICKQRARKSPAKGGLRAFVLSCAAYKPAEPTYASRNQVMDGVLPLAWGIIFRVELLQGLTYTLTVTRQSHIREIGTAHELLKVFQKTLFIRHFAHHLERMRP